MTTLNGSELLVKALEAQGAEKIFSIPGGQLMAAYEAIRTSPNLELIVPRQEGAGALMACGYALSRADPGVVISTVGAGVIYELAGLIYAWEERIPLISIAPQVQSWRIKPIQENLQAIDQDELYAPITKFHSIMYHYDRIPQLVARAYKIALAPEPGPVHLDLPMDIAFQKKSLSRSRMKTMIPAADKTRFIGKQAADPKEMQKAIRLIREAKRPLAFLGRMLARSADGRKALEQFLAKTKIPALSSGPAFSALSGKNAFFLGTVDLYENEQSFELISQSDLLLFLEPDEEIINFYRKISPRLSSSPVIQLSSYPLLFNSFALISSALAGSPELILEQIAEELAPQADPERNQWLEKLCQDRSRIFQMTQAGLIEPRQKDLRHSLEIINRVLKQGDFVVCEGREIVSSAKLYLENYQAGKVIFLPENVPAGAGFPLSLGIKAGSNQSRVFLLTDRKNFKYHCRELQTEVRYQMGICTLVFPDQEILAETEPDLKALAQSFGVKGFSIQEPVEEINEKLLGEAVELESGSLLEIRGF